MPLPAGGSFARKYFVKTWGWPGKYQKSKLNQNASQTLGLFLLLHSYFYPLCCLALIHYAPSFPNVSSFLSSVFSPQHCPLSEFLHFFLWKVASPFPEHFALCYITHCFIFSPLSTFICPSVEVSLPSLPLPFLLNKHLLKPLLWEMYSRIRSWQAAHWAGQED